MERCAVRTCCRPVDRTLKWESQAAGETFVCEKHYKDLRRKFKHLLFKPKKERAKKEEQGESLM